MMKRTTASMTALVIYLDAFVLYQRAHSLPPPRHGKIQ